MPERDPLVDPAPGDVIGYGTGKDKWLCIVTACTPETVSLRPEHLEQKNLPYEVSTIPLHMWRDWTGLYDIEILQRGA